MEIQELKRVLGAVRLKQQGLNILIARRDELLASAAAPGCGCYEINANRRSGYRSDRTGGAVVKAGELEEQAQAAYMEYLEAYKKARSLIDKADISPLCRLVLHYRYLIGENWEKVAAVLKITRSHAMRIHKKALESLAAAS